MQIKKRFSFTSKQFELFDKKVMVFINFAPNIKFPYLYQPCAATAWRWQCSWELQSHWLAQVISRGGLESGIL